MPDSWTLTRFFTPLAVQAASQALSYPLVAMVASRGPGGPLNLAGLAQANTVMFFLGMIAISSVTTGMVYAKTREGYQTFQKVTLLTGLGVIVLQGCLCIPVLSHLLFGRLIGLPPSIEQPAYTTFVISIPLQFLFFMRIPYFVVMYLGKATGMASLATIVRILLTTLLSLLFCTLGWVGPIWAVVCLTMPVIMEVLISRIFAAPFLKTLKSCPEKPPGQRKSLTSIYHCQSGDISSRRRPSSWQALSPVPPIPIASFRCITWHSASRIPWHLRRPACRPSCSLFHRNPARIAGHFAFV